MHGNEHEAMATNKVLPPLQWRNAWDAKTVHQFLLRDSCSVGFCCLSVCTSLDIKVQRCVTNSEWKYLGFGAIL